MALRQCFKTFGVRLTKLGNADLATWLLNGLTLCVNEPYHALQGFRGDHFRMCDIEKGTNICVLGSIKARVYVESGPFLFSPLKLGSPVPHLKIHNDTSTEHACGIPHHVSFADTN